MMQKVIITGATGMIALALTRYLLSLDDAPEIYCVARPESAKLGSIPDHPRVRVIECDMGDIQTLTSRIDSPCDTFFHFAWDGTFGDSRNDTALQMRNIANTLAAVTTAKELGCSCFIGAGSQAEYGRVEGNLSAETPVDPDNGYGIAKYTAGKLTRLLCRQIGMRHIWVRILSVYGIHDGANTLVMTCIKSFLNHSSISMTKGEQIWDYLYCDDAARALSLMAEKGVDGAVYPLGSGIGKPLAEYILTIRDMVAPTLVPGLGERPYAVNQVMHLCADISSLTRDTGFTPEISFEQGIQATVDWIQHGLSRNEG